MTEVKIDDFVYVLVAAIIILVVVLAIFAFVPPGGIGVTTSVENFTLGGGGIHRRKHDHAVLWKLPGGGREYGHAKENPPDRGFLQLLRGRTDSEEVAILNAYVPLAREATITFTVYDSTPGYGNLIIKWNGMELYRNGADRGRYTLHVPREQVQEINNLEISCDGPGAYFWASTAYVLRDFQIDLDYGSMKLLPFTLSSKDVETFKNGAFEFSSSGSGKLFVKVNGQTIFSATPHPSESVKFDLFNANINPGNNMISLSTQGGSFQLSNAVLKIFVSTDNLVKERTFTLPKDKFDLFLQGYRGRIDFEILNVTKEGSMSIRLNDKELNLPSLKEGANTVLFTAQEAKEGTNSLRFSGTGGWEIGLVDIGLER